MKRRTFAVLVWFALFGAILHAVPKDVWTSVTAPNFFLAGNVGEKELRRVAGKLEQFRAAFARLLPRTVIHSSAPMRVLVFKDRNVYRPFMPLWQGQVNEVAGHFQSGPDVHYIALSAELRDENPYGIIFHEYVHALTFDNVAHVPAWFGEGLAEFYSTFDVTDGDRKVWLGKPVASHVRLLRERKFLPLARLFAVDHDSPEYNERDKKSLFYAESWALVHYLMLGENGRRQPQLLKYLTLLARGTAGEESFRQAFQTDFAALENELSDYVNRPNYPVEIFTAEQKLAFDAPLTAAPLSEAEAQFYLGDLLLHQQRPEAEEYLQRALTLDPQLSPAHAALAVARVKQRRFAEAQQHLEKSMAGGAPDYLLHYYYAFVHSRAGMDERQIVTGYPPETARRMREHLQRAIALAPTFTEAYRLLAFINLATGEQLEESATLLRRAIALAPGRQDPLFTLAQVYLRQRKYDDARQLVEPLAAGAADPTLRTQAQQLLDTIKTVTTELARFKEQTGQPNLPPPDPPLSAEQRARLAPGRRFEGEQLRGLLTHVDCTDKGLTLTVKADGKIVRLHTTTPERVQFMTWTQEVGILLTCGPINPAQRVIVTYRASTDARAPFAGEPIAVEFVKEGQ